jgi:hypothetical protein
MYTYSKIINPPYILLHEYEAHESFTYTNDVTIVMKGKLSNYLSIAIAPTQF